MDSVVTKKLDGKVFAPVGFCIYCRATQDLTKEHILPFGLGGTAVLPKSSCRDCASITGRIEQTVLRGPMWPVRLYRKLNSRTKHREAPTEYPLTILRGDEEIKLSLPLGEYPILLHFPVFPVPAYLEQSEYSQGIKLVGERTIHFGPKIEDVVRKYQGTSFRVTTTHLYVEFARVIAKVAYSWAVAEGALEMIEGEPFVTSAILGRSDDIGQWVGTVGGVYGKDPAVHSVILRPDYRRQIFIGEVRLFADSQAPAYCVVLGRLRGGRPTVERHQETVQVPAESSLQFYNCLICDDAQIEPNGKLTIAGFFGLSPDVEVVVQSLHNSVNLTLILFGRGEVQSSRRLTIEITQPTGRPVCDTLSMDLTPPGKRANAIAKFQSITLPEEGEYAITVGLDGTVDYRTTFRVSLASSENLEKNPNPA
jgi:hypothetical protein